MAPVRRGETQKTSPFLVDDRRSEDGEGRGGAKSNTIIIIMKLVHKVHKQTDRQTENEYQNTDNVTIGPT